MLQKYYSYASVMPGGLMLKIQYYAQNYAGIIRQTLEGTDLIYRLEMKRVSFYISSKMFLLIFFLLGATL